MGTATSTTSTPRWTGSHWSATSATTGAACVSSASRTSSSTGTGPRSACPCRSLPDIGMAYGGELQFTVKSTYGDFHYLNSPLDWVSLECDECNNGRGLRIIRFTDQLLNWDGTEKRVSLDLA